MGNGHGGRKIRILFDSDNKGEIQFEVREIAYPHSSRSKRFSGSGEWVAWEQKGFHRPAQAFQELLLALKEKDFLTSTMSKDLLEFMIKEKLLTPEELYSLSQEPDDVFGKFFKVTLKGLYGVDMNKENESKNIN